MKHSSDRRRPRPPILAGLLLLAALPAAAQDPPQEAFAGEVTVSEVALDVVVTDARGRVVVGLDRDDFRVKEDGRPVELSEVVFYSHRELMEEAISADELNVDTDLLAHRYFILLFHDQRQLAATLAARQLDAARWAKRWVRTELGPRDLVAVFSYQYGLRPQIDFSNDRDAIASAIDHAIVSQETHPSRLPAADAGMPSLLASLASPEELARETTTIYDALEKLAGAADAVGGRKNLVLFSIGFDSETDDTFFRPDPRYFPRVVQAMNDANLAAYAVDLAPSAARGDAVSRQRGNSLSYLATETGGRHFSNYVNVATPLSEIEEATGGYYLLTYRSRRPAGESGYQRVDVELVNPGFTARAREGYLYGGGSGG